MKTFFRLSFSASPFLPVAFAFALALVLFSNALSAADLPAFPGAEGFGATTPGGRGGKVLFVTNLDDARSRQPSRCL